MKGNLQISLEPANPCRSVNSSRRIINLTKRELIEGVGTRLGLLDL